jgi:hypothetical protein
MEIEEKLSDEWLKGWACSRCSAQAETLYAVVWASPAKWGGTNIEPAESPLCRACVVNYYGEEVLENDTNEVERPIFRGGPEGEGSRDNPLRRGYPSRWTGEGSQLQLLREAEKPLIERLKDG